MDVLLEQGNDGGEITIDNGITELSDGLANSVYLSLFGGNADDSGLQGDDTRQWWGNLGETELAKQYRSQTQNLLRSIPLNTSNLQRIEDAASSDLAWMQESLASRVEVSVTMPALNKVRIQIFVEVNDQAFQFSFVAKGAQSS